MAKATVKNLTDIRLIIGTREVPPRGEISFPNWQFVESGDDVKALLTAKAISVKVAKEQPIEEAPAAKKD